MAVTPPTLATARLELRPPMASDIPHSLAIMSDGGTARFLGPHVSPADHFQRFCRSAGSWLLYGYGLFVIRPRGEEDVIGTCAIFHSWRDLGPDFDDHPEAGWMLRRDQHGRGLAQEAMTAALDWFDRTHGLRVVCMINSDNTPSLRLAGKLGFETLRQTTLPEGEAVGLFGRRGGRR